MNMNQNISNTFLIWFRIVFYFCAFYFFVMGVMLVLLPHLLVRNVVGGEISPVFIGMLRGAGGSIIPYSLIYVLIALKPVERRWAAYIIALANGIAIILDFTSVLIGEYKFVYAMFDVPIEVLSLLVIILFYTRAGKKE
jgi:hypothetical protein